MDTKPKIRRYPRVGLPKGILVAWDHCGIRKVSRAIVLAVGGLFVSTAEPAAVGESIHLIFELPGGEVRARAVVRDSQRNRGMGLEFTFMAQESRARLTYLMKTLSVS